MTRFSAIIPLAAAALLLVSCGGPGDGPAPVDVIALVDGEPVPVQEVETYIRLTVGEDPDDISDEVKSDLLDQLLVYRLVEAEALEAGHTVGREEVDRRLRDLDLDTGGSDGEGLPQGFLRQLRRSILVDRYLAEEVVGEVDITEEELAEARGAKRTNDEGPLVVYRQAMTQTREEAEEIMDRVSRDREPFARVAGEVSISPGGAEPQLARVGQLPPSVGRALTGGPKGGLVGPVPVDCGLEEAPDACRYYVFLVEDRDDRGMSSVPTEEAVRESVRRTKQAERLERYLDTLRGSGRIEVRPENLPFHYAPSRPKEATS